jgi:hypothetical protein
MANIDFLGMACQEPDRARSIWDQSTPNDDDPGTDTLDSWFRSWADWRWNEYDASIHFDLAGQLPLLGDDQQALRRHQRDRRNRQVVLNRSVLVTSEHI